MRNETIFQYLPPGPKEAIHRAQLNWENNPLSTPRNRVTSVLQDSNDVLREGISKLVPVVSAIYSEVAAVRGACLVVVTLQCFHTTIESDYQSLILLCTREDGPPWEIANFVEDIIAIA
ncbi:unnamed protein product [Ilex paraguariensis]|uniref:Uncharacterized protein n=1 Tax=Ilex paraguariensis TaxID=185542 RepID=A0ABC8SEE7_9AQUA